MSRGATKERPESKPPDPSARPPSPRPSRARITEAAGLVITTVLPAPFPYMNRGSSTVQRCVVTLNRRASAIHAQERQERGSCRSWLSRVARNERPESKPPGSRQADPTTRSQTPSPWFRHDQLLRRRSAQPTSLLPSRLSRVARNKRPESKPPDSRQADPTTRSQTPSPWFRHDQLLRRRSAQPTSLLPSRLSRVARNKRPESKPSTEKTRDAVAMRSLWKRVIPSALAGMGDHPVRSHSATGASASV